MLKTCKHENKNNKKKSSAIEENNIKHDHIEFIYMRNA